MENTAPAPVSPAPNHPRFVRWAVVIGIVVVLNVVFLVVRSLVLPSPDMADFCPHLNAPAPETEQGCAALQGTWTDYGAAAPSVKGDAAARGYCDLYTACQPAYQAAQSKYEMYGFVIMVAFGILAIIGGVLPLGSAIVETGLSFGGVVALVIGSGMYWGDAGNWLRLWISLAALGALLGIAWKRFRD